MILERELRTLVQMPSDTTNDSKDNTQLYIVVSE
nr:MAG TPA: hypothetical protein [Caudoviricetes sp.]